MMIIITRLQVLCWIIMSSCQATDLSTPMDWGLSSPWPVHFLSPIPHPEPGGAVGQEWGPGGPHCRDPIRGAKSSSAQRARGGILLPPQLPHMVSPLDKALSPRSVLGLRGRTRNSAGCSLTTWLWSNQDSQGLGMWTVCSASVPREGSGVNKGSISDLR